MTDWITVIVVALVIFFGLFIFYRGLKEPLDLLFYWIYRLLLAMYISIKRLFIKASVKSVQTAEEIVYG